jgi:SAM-dependent methyltransferase
MPWSSLFQLTRPDPIPDPGLPRRLLRHLFLPEKLGLGGRLLDIGCGAGELTQFCNLLGVETVGLDERADRVTAARRAAPQLDFFHVKLDQPLPVLDQTFDIVLVRDLAVHRLSLRSADALAATANLLATVRPGGQLVLLARADHDGGTTDDWHAPNCLARHLGTFPGSNRVVDLYDWPMPFAAITWMLGRHVRPGFRIATLTTPREAISRRQWLDFATAAGQPATSTCCPWFASQRGDTGIQRHAA